LLIDRSMFQITPDNASKVEIERKGKKIVLERQGDRFVPAKGTEAAPARIGEVVETLVSLRAEAAVHTGASKSDEGFATPELVIRTEPHEGSKKKTIRIGAGDSWQGISVHYARVEGADATYVLAKSKVRAILDAF
jgi:hypothetical protein